MTSQCINMLIVYIAETPPLSEQLHILDNIHLLITSYVRLEAVSDIFRAMTLIALAFFNCGSLILLLLTAMLLKSSGTFDNSLLDTRSSRIVIRLLSGPFVIISVLARKTILDIIGISYSVISLIISKIRPPLN